MTRAGRERWLDEGLEVLARDGAEALSPELLAARLGLQRGAFAWHFGDLDGYKAALVEHWAARALDGDTQRIFGGDPRADRAMRALASHDVSARAAVERVDRARLGHLTEIHRAAGAANPEGLARLELALFVGATWLYEDLDGPEARALAADFAALTRSGSARRT